MNVLVISPFFPFPPISGGHTRVLNLIQQLSEKHTIDYLSFFDKNSKDGLGFLSRFCRNIYTVDPGISSKLPILKRFPLGRTLRRLVWLVCGIPFQASGFFFPEFKTKLNAILRDNTYDIIQVELPRMALHLSNDVFIDYPAAKIVIDYDISYLVFQRLLQQTSSLPVYLLRYLDYRLNKKFACSMWSKFDRLVVVSETDRNKVQRLLPSLLIDVVPNGVDTNTLVPAPGIKDRTRLVMLGGVIHNANIDAFEYFYNTIYSIVKNNNERIELIIAGEGWKEHPCTRKCGSNVGFPGFVKDISTILDSSSILIAPIRVGGGTRLKILEAMALGVPVVSTSIGCEGIGVVNGKEMIIADTPADFAKGIGRLINDESFCRQVCLNARQHVVDHFDWSAIGRVLNRVYFEALNDRTHTMKRTAVPGHEK